MSNSIIPNVAAGTIIGTSPTFPPNAVVRGDSLYIRDANGNRIPGCSTDDGDEITVLDIGYTRQLALIQYPVSNGNYKQGYVTNATNIIQYKDNYSWVNGSTLEQVYDLDKTTGIGSLDPHERAVVLYKMDGMTAVVYDTGKGKLTKSGLVNYAGSGGGAGSTGSASFNGIRPGQVVPGGFTYDNNAQVVGDELYLRDENGNRLPGRSVSVGDKITVLDVGYTKQLALIQYQGTGGVIQGYVTNATSLIKYFNPYTWHNGSTTEEVLDENGHGLGSLSPHESATPLYKKNGMTHVVYNTNKGPNTKSGFVKYEGSSPTLISIPSPSVTNAQRIVYGTSGKGRDLAAYKIGNGSNSLVFVCAIHGWEDHWAADGIELTKIGNGLIEHFQNTSTNNWSLYIIPAANPDGVSEGSTNDGPGRCTIVDAVDCNRDFPIGFTPFGTNRYWTGAKPLSVPESRCLHDFISRIKNNTSGETCVIDLHGWEDKTIGDPKISHYFQNEFGFRKGNFDNIYQDGFLISWANYIGARAALIELPESCSSHSDVVNGGYLQKIINAVTNLIGASGSSSASTSTATESFNGNGLVINVQSHLNIRAGAGTNYDVVGSLHSGQKIDIIGKSGAWYQIRFNGITGFVHSDYIKVVTGETSSGSSETSINKTGEVINVQSHLNVRAGAGTNYDVVGSLHSGQKVDIIGKSGAWYQIKFNGITGFVHSDYIKVVTAETSSDSPETSINKTGEVVNVTSSLNIRSGAGTNYNSIGTLHQGDYVEIVGETGDWYKIKHGSGYGYVYSTYITKSTKNEQDNLNEDAKALKFFNDALCISLPYIGYEKEIYESELFSFKIALQSETDIIQKNTTLQFVNNEFSGIQYSGGAISEEFLKFITFELGAGKNVQLDLQTIFGKDKILKDGQKISIALDIEYKCENNENKAIISAELQKYCYESSYAKKFINAVAIFEINIDNLKKKFEEFSKNLEQLVDKIRKEIKNLFEKLNSVELIGFCILATIVSVIALPEAVLAGIVSAITAVIISITSWITSLGAVTALAGALSILIRLITEIGAEFACA